jgi:hypothetical protein
MISVLDDPKRLRSFERHDGSFGSWSCKNALAEALTCHDVGEVAMHGLFSDVASFPTGGAADADSSRPGQFFNNR